MKSTDRRIEFTDDGFIISQARWFRKRSLPPIRWASVASIQAVMWDCFSCHTFGFRLTLADGRSVCVTDSDPQWQAFRGRLHTEFPQIDPVAVQEVEAAFPGELELTCWEAQRAQQVGGGSASISGRVGSDSSVGAEPD